MYSKFLVLLTGSEMGALIVKERIVQGTHRAKNASSGDTSSRDARFRDTTPGYQLRNMRNVMFRFVKK
jgi:hypothetical protein